MITAEDGARPRAATASGAAIAAMPFLRLVRRAPLLRRDAREFAVRSDGHSYYFENLFSAIQNKRRSAS